MKLKGLLKYFVYLFFIILFLCIKTIITKEMNKDMFAYAGYPALIISTLTYFLFGILVAGMHLLQESKHKGKWMINYQKLLLLGIPLLYLSSFWFLFYSNNHIIQSLGKPLESIMVVANTNVSLVQVLLGYHLVTSIYKND